LQRAARNFLFGLETADAVTVAAVPALLGVIAAIANLPAGTSRRDGRPDDLSPNGVISPGRLER